jgi:hypothetical protein
METQKRKSGRPRKEVHRVRVNFTIDPESLRLFKEICNRKNLVESRLVDDFIRQFVLENQNNQ